MSSTLSRSYFNAATSTDQPFDVAVTIRERLQPGDGTIVLFHGLGCGRRYWEPILEMADEMDTRSDPYTLIAVDLPGHGDTPPSHVLAPYNVDLPQGESSWFTTMERLIAALAETGPVHLVAHSASAPTLINVVHELEQQYGMDTVVANLGALISIEGNHTPADCGIVSERISTQHIEWYVASGHAALGAELLAKGTVDAIAWSRMWERADPADVHDIAEYLALASLGDYQILGQRWLDYPRRAYLYGQLSSVPSGTRELMTTIYPQRETYLRSIPSADHFPMITSPSETLEAIMGAITYCMKD